MTSSKTNSYNTYPVIYYGPFMVIPIPLRDERYTFGLIISNINSYNTFGLCDLSRCLLWSVHGELDNTTAGSNVYFLVRFLAKIHIDITFIGNTRF